MKGKSLEQFTKAEAIAFAKSGEWKKLSQEERAALFLNQRLLCMPFDVAHKAVEVALGRPVWTHEFVDIPRLKDEWKTGEKPSLENIMSMIDRDKMIVVVTE